MTRDNCHALYVWWSRLPPDTPFQGFVGAQTGGSPVNLRVMTIDERIERLTARVEGLVMTAELHQKELQSLAAFIQTDAENIRALARIAEIH